MEFGGSAEWIPVQEMNRRLRAAEAEAHTHEDGSGEGESNGVENGKVEGKGSV